MRRFYTSRGVFYEMSRVWSGFDRNSDNVCICPVCGSTYHRKRKPKPVIPVETPIDSEVELRQQGTDNIDLHIVDDSLSFDADERVGMDFSEDLDISDFVEVPQPKVSWRVLMLVIIILAVAFLVCGFLLSRSATNFFGKLVPVMLTNSYNCFVAVLVYG